MRLPGFFIRWLMNRGVRVCKSRPADLVLVLRGELYLRRWHVIPRNRWFNVYLHQIAGPDDDRALHDHPWWNCSILLAGSYDEMTFKNPELAPLGVTETVTTRRTAGEVVFRTARTMHRLAPVNGSCWTLFLTGPVLRAWGFRRPDGVWVHHSQYVETAAGVSSIKG